MSSDPGVARVLVDGIVMGASPRWHGGRLWFCDWGVGAVVAVDVDGRREVMARVDSLPLSIDWLPGDRLVVVDSTRHRLLRQAPGGTLVTHADRPRCRGPGGQALRAHDRR